MPSAFRIALANIEYPGTPEGALSAALAAIAEAGEKGAQLICFAEAYVPGYRCFHWQVPAPDTAFLERAWAAVADAAKQANVAVILGTERVVDSSGRPRISALVVDRDGTVLGFQDKVQLDPSEDTTYSPAAERQVFETRGVKFGIAICHEGWRYPETVRWAARRGAQVVFHPHLHIAEPGSYRPATFADPANTFHEKAAMCRAAENTCYFAMVNCASEGSGTTSAVASPDGSVLCWQPYGQSGLLIADLDLSLATGLLASRCRSEG